MPTPVCAAWWLRWPEYADSQVAGLCRSLTLVGLYEGLRSSASWPSELERVADWYRPHLERLHDDAAIRNGDLVQMARIAAGYSSRERFLTELTLDPPEATSDESGPPSLDEDYLVLSTIHSAKGQEWSAVYVLNVVDGCIPSDLGVGSSAQVDEERRLLYVAMTRAKQHLTLMVPQRFYTTGQRAGGDRHVYASLTRFIPSQVASCFESVCDVAASAVTGLLATPAGVDIAQRLRNRWA